jgi:tetratricopeptide (TPR) repeat protein
MRWPIGVLPAQPAVYELIGRGRAHLLNASRREIPEAVAAFTSAIELDPTYAAAHAGLALACCAKAELRIGPAAEAYEAARTAALRALAMEEANADAQVALATVLFLSDWNWIGARRCLERALEIDPDHTDACLLYGRLLEALGDLDNGLAAKQKALERNPFSPQVHLQIAHAYWNQRKYDLVIEWAEKTLQLDPRHVLAREYLAGAYMKKGDGERHMAEGLRHAETAGVPNAIVEELRQLYATGGRRAVIDYALRQPGAPHIQLALLNGEAGNLDKAFRHLHMAIDVHDPSLVHLAVAPQWDLLRSDPRFAACLERMGLSLDATTVPVVEAKR